MPKKRAKSIGENFAYAQKSIDKRWFTM